jgi:hypothetical protein
MAVPSLVISATNTCKGYVGCMGSDCGQVGVMKDPDSSIARFATAKDYTSDSQDKVAICEGTGSETYSSRSCRISNLVDSL